MNLAEALLAADAGKITKKDVKDFEVKRLTKIVGEPFILHLQQKFRTMLHLSVKVENLLLILINFIWVF